MEVGSDSPRSKPQSAFKHAGWHLPSPTIGGAQPLEQLVSWMQSDSVHASTAMPWQAIAPSQPHSEVKQSGSHWPSF